MSSNLFDYMEIPTREEREKIRSEAQILKELFLDVDLQKRFENHNLYIDDLELNREFSFWLRQFNNRIGELNLTYIMLRYYFNKGIPDDEWYISPGRNGCSVEYFPHFDGKHHCIKYFFDYYSDIFYYKFFGVWDSIFHLINIFYRINITEHKNGFKNKVLKDLKCKNINLYNFINKCSQEDVYKKANRLRNDLTHNFPSNDIDSGVVRLGQGITLLTTGNYVTTKEFMNNIDGVLMLLSEVLAFLKECFEAPLK